MSIQWLLSAITGLYQRSRIIKNNNNGNKYYLPIIYTWQCFHITTNSIKNVIIAFSIFQIIRSFKVPRDSSTVGCEYTIQFYAISFLKEDTEWTLKKVKVIYPISKQLSETIPYYLVNIQCTGITRCLFLSSYHH